MQYERTLAIVLAFLIGACSSTTKLVEPVSREVQIEPEFLPFSLIEMPLLESTRVPEIEDIFSLTSAQEQHFLDYYYSKESAHLNGHKRLEAYLVDALYDFTFLGQTYDASTALTKLSGNCLSLAILTTALADLVGIQVGYQKVNSAPVYLRQNGVLALSAHVRTHVYDPDYQASKDAIVIQKPKVIIDYFPAASNIPGEMISRQNFIAKFYQNLAGQALFGKDYELTYALLEKGIKVDPKNPETLNSIAVLFTKMERKTAAGAVYRYILSNTKGSVYAISNYAQLLQSEGDDKAASQLYEKLDGVFDSNPYRWLDEAEKRLENGQLNAAYKYYARAIEIAPYLHDGHFGMAKLHYIKGQTHKALKYLQTAKEYAFMPEQEKLYQSKLISLRQ